MLILGHYWIVEALMLITAYALPGPGYAVRRLQLTPPFQKTKTKKRVGFCLLKGFDSYV